MAGFTQNVNTFTDYGIQAQDIERRRKMAEMLQQQALMPIEQSSAGGYVTPISWTQGLAKALQGYAGMKGQERATQEEKALSHRYTTDRGEALASALKAGEGTAATPEKWTGEAGDELYQPEVAARPADRMATYRSLASSKFPELQTMGMAELLKTPESLFGRIQPNDYTPESVAKFSASKNFSDLVPVRKMEAVQMAGPNGAPATGFVNPYAPPQNPIPQPEKTDFNKPFNADGSPNKAYQDYQERLRREGRPSVSVTVPVNTEKKYGESFASKIADADVSLRDAAEKAPQLAERANRIKQVLASGNAITGFGADFRLGFGKAAALAGLESAGDAAANTETLAAGLAQNTMDAIKASGMGGGTGFSNADRDFLEKAVGGKITLEPQAISRLADLAHRAASMTADRWTKRASQIPKSAIEGTGIDISPVRVPALGAKEAAPSNVRSKADAILNGNR